MLKAARGQTVVRSVRDCGRRYANAPRLMPLEHPMIFNEAPRAHGRIRVPETHRISPRKPRLEPNHFLTLPRGRPDGVWRSG